MDGENNGKPYWLMIWGYPYFRKHPHELFFFRSYQVDSFRDLEHQNSGLKLLALGIMGAHWPSLKTCKAKSAVNCLCMFTSCSFSFNVVGQNRGEWMQGRPTWIKLRPQHTRPSTWPRAQDLRPFLFQSHQKPKYQQASMARTLKFCKFHRAGVHDGWHGGMA